MVEFETHFDRHRPVADKSRWQSQPAPGVSVVYDLGTHLMDQVLVLYGMPKRVTGFVSSVREGNDIGFDDACTVLLHYDCLLATVKAQVVSPETRQLRYWVRGTKGSFKKVCLVQRLFLDGILTEIVPSRCPGGPAQSGSQARAKGLWRGPA